LLQQTLVEGNETFDNASTSTKFKTEKGQYQPFQSNYLNSGMKTPQADKPKATLERSVGHKPLGVSLTLSKVQGTSQDNIKRDSDKLPNSRMSDKLPQMFSQKQHLRELLMKKPGVHDINCFSIKLSQNLCLCHFLVL
jgi:hypothetical protein